MRYGPVSFPLVVEGDEAQAELDRVFGPDVEAAAPLMATPSLPVIDVRSVGLGRVRVRTGPEPPRTVPTRRIAGELLPAMTRAVLDAEGAWTHLHAAAPAIGGRAVVLSGRSGQGKTTLACTLARGHRLLGDELVAVDAAAGVVRAWRRPLSLKRFLDNEARLLADGDDVPDDDWWAPPSALGLTWVEVARPGLVLVLDRRPGPAALEPLTRAGAMVTLLSNSFDAPRDPTSALGHAAWLVASSRCSTASYEEGADLVPLVTAELATRLDDGVVEGPFRLAGGSPVAAEVASVAVDGRAVVYDARARRAVQLDPAATELWRALVAGAPTPPGSARFVEELAGLGLLRDEGR